jgi:hypothetical protein
VLELRRKVTVEEDATIPVETAFVTVQTIDGRRFECHVTQSRGTMARPMSDAELEAKFRSLAEYGAPTLDAERLIAAIWAIYDQQDRRQNHPDDGVITSYSWERCINYRGTETSYPPSGSEPRGDPKARSLLLQVPADVSRSSYWYRRGSNAGRRPSLNADDPLGIPTLRGTAGSKPLSSSGESTANLGLQV